MTTTHDAPPGDRHPTLTVPITTDSLTGRSIISYDYTFTYNPSVLTPLPTPYDTTGTLSSGLEVHTNIPSPGTLVAPVSRRRSSSDSSRAVPLASVRTKRSSSLSIACWMKSRDSSRCV